MVRVNGRVLIVGGGIAGFALAQALHQRGIPALMLDRLSGPPDAGLGINLPGNAIQALRALGLADALADLGAPVRRREYRDAQGKMLFSVDEDAFWGKEARPRCVRRAELLTLLGTGLPAGTVRWNAPVTAVRLDADGVEITLADGATETGGFVVGADGVHSGVRTTVLGATELRTALLSAASWRFMATDPGVDCWSVWTGPDGTFLLLPAGAGQVYGYASATGGGPVDPDPEWLRTTFAGYPSPVPEVVAEVLADRSSLYHSPVEEVRIDRWSQGRAVLIGDAAHATAPVWAQGAALALEDALVLAELLATKQDWAEVGPEYEQRRRPRVTHVQNMTDRMSRAVQAPGWLRDRLLPQTGPRTFEETYAPLRTPVTGHA